MTVEQLLTDYAPVFLIIVGVFLVTIWWMATTHTKINRLNSEFDEINKKLDKIDIASAGNGSSVN